MGRQIIKTFFNHIESTLSADSTVSIQLIAEIGKEDFYKKIGFELIPNGNSGTTLRKVIYNQFYAWRIIYE